MGKRKAARKPGKKAKLKPLDKVFRCLFCQHAGVVHCKLDRQEMVSRIECARCAQHFETKIDHLTEPIDVYSAWIDATELANRPLASPVHQAQPANDPQRAEPDRFHSSSHRQERSFSKAPRAEEHYETLYNEDSELPENIF
ncbi:hypothetical protein O181_046606 [Austropuccinia psidii MF-1]|uniref:Transcription elongation factor 1 homolog n=1 Tax=Austropuccinia psidii MF-1 TaxID=1389203 RepID=A0A9Q3HIS6_9BASI|nr:hypothetical protein [Austropuccinia psidii MF-1]